MKIYSRYSPSPKVQTVDASGQPSLTKQSFAKEADINTIARRYIQTGQLPSGNRVPQFGDFIGTDFQTLQNQLIDANEQFMSLPSHIRRRFGNNPASLVEWLSDPANAQEAVRLGLAEKRPVAADIPDTPGQTYIPGTEPAKGSKMPSNQAPNPAPNPAPAT